MAGAYTATPAVTAEADLPPGWNPIWPHPGPWPPGYTPTLALSLTSSATVEPGGTVSDVASALTDQIDYVTTEPETPINWTATWDDTDESLPMNLDGGEDFLASVSTDYSDVGDSFWGAEPDITFDTAEADAGRSFTLAASSTPFDGFPVSATKQITVEEEEDPVKSATYTIEFAGSITGGESAGIYMEAGVTATASYRKGTPDAEIWFDILDGESIFDGYPGGVFTIEELSSTSVRITASAIEELDYLAFALSRSVWIDPPGGTMTLTAVLLSDGVPIATKVTETNHSSDPEENQGNWNGGWASVDIQGETISTIDINE